MIIHYTEKYAVKRRNTYDELKKLENEIKNENPEEIRKNFDKYWDIVNNKDIEINERKEEVEEAINNLEDGKELLEKISILIQNIKNIMNSYQIGTLQGLSRQAIKENNIVPNENDEVAQNVLNQPYNELEDINRNNSNVGGRKSRKSRKGRKSRKSRKGRK